MRAIFRYFSILFCLNNFFIVSCREYLKITLNMCFERKYYNEDHLNQTSTQRRIKGRGSGVGNSPSSGRSMHLNGAIKLESTLLSWVGNHSFYIAGSAPEYVYFGYNNYDEEY